MVDDAHEIGNGIRALMRRCQRVGFGTVEAEGGRIHWVDGAAVVLDADAIGDLAAREAGIVAHMNDDHADAIQLYAHRLLALGGDGWRMTGLDPDGCDLRRGAETARLMFDHLVGNADAARVELVRLVKVARERAEAA